MVVVSKKKSMTAKEIKTMRICSIAFILFSILLYFYLIPMSTMAADAFENLGPRFFPNVLSIALGVLGVMQFISTFYIPRENKPAEAGTNAVAGNDKEETVLQSYDVKANRKRELLTVIGVMLALVLYVFIFMRIPYLIGTCLVATIIMLIMKNKVWYHYPIVYGCIAIIYFSFTMLLYVWLP